MTSVEFQRFKDILKFVLESTYSDFYRQKYARAGFNPEDLIRPEDVSRVPFLTKQELAASDPFSRVYRDPAEPFEIKYTSGTTRSYPAILLAPYDRKRVTRGMSETLNYNQAKKLFILAPPATAVKFHGLILKEGVTFAVGDPSNLPAAALIAKHVKIDGIFSYVTLAINFGEYLKKIYDPNEIRCLFLRGEAMTALRLKTLKASYPRATIQWNYGMAELSALGFRCNFLGEEDLNIFHALPERYFYEVVDGELVVTNISMDDIAMPFIRYRTGDAAELVVRPCACGRSGLLLRVFGRQGADIIKVGGGMITVAMLEEGVQKIGGIEDFQVHIYEKIDEGRLKPQIVVEAVASHREPYERELFRMRFAQTLKIAPTLTLFDAIDKKIFLPLEVKWVEKISRSGPKKVHLVNHIGENA